MGKNIDRAVRLALCAVGFYLLFVQLFNHIVLACAASFLLCIPLVRRKTGQAKMSAAQAQSILYSWACGSDDNARASIARLLKITPESMVYLPRPPVATLSAADVFSTWKAHRDEDSLLLAALCPADGKARAYARTLREPSIKIADAAFLTARIRRSELAPPRVSAGGAFFRRLKNALAALPERRPWRQNVLFGVLLLPVYLLTGNAAYLFLSIAALFLAGVALRPGKG